jgi:hypothetical protein
MTSLSELSNTSIGKTIGGTETNELKETKVILETFRQIIIRPGPLDLSTGGWRNNVEFHDVPLKWKITGTDGIIETQKVDWLGVIAAEYLKRHPDQHVLDFPTISEDVCRVYQMCHTDDYKTIEAKEVETQDSERNHLAEYLLPERKFVWGAVAVIANDLKNVSMPSDKLDMNELEYLVSHRANAVVVSIEPGNGGALTEKVMTASDINLAITAAGEYAAERQILGEKGYSLVGWRSVSNLEPNWTASRLLASKVRGVWVFAVKKSADMYLALTSEEITQLSHICAGPTSRSEQTPKEIEANKKGYFNRYYLLRERIEGMRAVCECCNKIPVKPVWCGGCYRMRYCNEHCQKENWDSHKLDCSFAPPAPESDVNKSAASATQIQ